MNNVSDLRDALAAERDVPEQNRRLMIAVVAEVFGAATLASEGETTMKLDDVQIDNALAIINERNALRIRLTTAETQRDTAMRALRRYYDQHAAAAATWDAVDKDGRCECGSCRDARTVLAATPAPGKEG